MILFPNAKINIGLDVVARRADGYHELSTLFCPVGWHDILEIVPATGETTTLNVSGNAVDCPAEKNLVMKAYGAINERVPLPNVDIFLHKIIPDGAGLGGGSSDAAFTLIGLNKLFNLGMSNEDLAEIAATLGADCPFFIYNKPLMASGIGEIFSEAPPIDLAEWDILIAKPDVHVSTADAFRGISPTKPEVSLAERLASTAVEEWQGCVTNQFELTVIPLHPAIGQVKQAMIDSGATYVSMTGSGAAVYGLYRRSEADRMSAARNAMPTHTRCWQGNLADS